MASGRISNAPERYPAQHQEDPPEVGFASFEDQFALVQPPDARTIELVARLEESSTCIAIRSDGRPCGLPTTAVDPLRGERVCAIHDPAAP